MVLKQHIEKCMFAIRVTINIILFIYVDRAALKYTQITHIMVVYLRMPKLLENDTKP
jgi:hypothetical protein